MNTEGLPLMRIGMSDTLSEILGAEFVGAMQSFAHVVELKSGISPWLETAFRARHFGPAVGSPPFVDTTQVELHALFRDPFVIAMPKSFEDRALGRIGVDRPTRFNFDSTQSLLRFVQAGYGWAITSAFCLLQSPTALKDLHVVPCPNSTPREFSLLNRADEHRAVATAAHKKFNIVFNQLSSGPWGKINPKTAAMIREANV